MSIKRSGRDLIEVILQPTADADFPKVNHADALRAVMEFYESAEIGDEEENEVDLMIQLSGMPSNNMQSDD